MEDWIIHWNLDPNLLWITDSFPLKYYGLLFVSGLLLGYVTVKKVYQKENISVEYLDTLATYIAAGTIIGARLGHCLFYDFAYYSQHILEIFLPVQKVNSSYAFVGYQGLASHGGAIGVLIAVGLYCYRYRQNFLWTVDRIALAVPITGMCIRLANFMNSEIIGKPTKGGYGVIFEQIDTVVRHPAQLYEALAYLILFVILQYVYYNTILREKKGFIFGIFLIFLFTARFCIEFFKENQSQFEDAMAINMGQTLSIPFIIIGGILSVHAITRSTSMYST